MHGADGRAYPREAHPAAQGSKPEQQAKQHQCLAVKRNCDQIAAGFESRADLGDQLAVFKIVREVRQRKRAAHHHQQQHRQPGREQEQLSSREALIHPCSYYSE